MNREKHQPEFDRFLRCIKRESVPGPVPIAEYFADAPIIEELTGEKFGLSPGDTFIDWAELNESDEKRAKQRVVDLIMKFCLEIGQDYTYIELPTGIQIASPISLSEGKKTWWHVKGEGPIQNMEDFEQFPWPKNHGLDFTLLDLANQSVPEGMKIFVLLGGVFELSSFLMGFNNFAIGLYDSPDLIKAIIARVGDIIAYQAKTAVQYEEVGGLWQGDDLGFYSGTLIKPDMIRELILPQYKRIVEIAHSQNKLYIWHSCGKVNEIMPDIIAMGVDAKHSFEDKILPVEDAYQLWGREIGIVGGLDMDLLTRGSEKDVRQRTREILDVCGIKGGYALGTGNSVADYVPIRNFLAMLDEGRKWNKKNFSV